MHPAVRSYSFLWRSLQLLNLDGLLTSMDTPLDANVETALMQLDVPVVVVPPDTRLDALADLARMGIPLDVSVVTAWLQDRFPLLS
jgi:hypothetical protein